MDDGSELTDDQAAALGAGMCCCLIGFIGLVVLIIWLVRRQPGATPGTGARRTVASQPAAVAAVYVPPGTGAPHLSVLAVGLDLAARARVEAATGGPLAATNVVDARVELVRRTAQALLDVEPRWTHFGYGEKDLADLNAAQQSYRFASEDFRSRARVAAQPQGTYAVAILILATRSHLHGVSRLDGRAQARAALVDRLTLGRDTLLGADLLWAPAEGGVISDTLLQQFPEVHLLTGVPSRNE